MYEKFNDKENYWSNDTFLGIPLKKPNFICRVYACGGNDSPCFSEIKNINEYLDIWNESPEMLLIMPILDENKVEVTIYEWNYLSHEFSDNYLIIKTNKNKEYKIKLREE